MLTLPPIHTPKSVLQETSTTTKTKLNANVTQLLPLTHALRHIIVTPQRIG